MLTEFRAIVPGDTLGRAVELILQGSQQDCPVLAEGRAVGVLTRADLLKALAQQPQSSRIESVMRRDFQTVDAGEMLETAFARLQECECHTLPVLRQAKLVGLITSENLGEFLMIQAALKESATGAPMPPPTEATILRRSLD